MKCTKKYARKIAAAAMSFGILLSVVATGNAVSADASYEGDGTKSSPYLVKTAQQLDGMRNNLKAHYKLAADIDLAGYKSADPTPKGNYGGGWVPIGVYGDSKSFSGSFTCDTGADGKPLYQIKNLTVTNLAGQIYGHTMNKYKSYSDAKDGECYWEAGLFGTIRNATISNIKITAAKIKNTVLGQNQMTNEGTSAIIPCSSQMGAAILAAKIYGSTIKGCIVEGSVESATNGVGGLIGTASKSSISGCDATVTINGTGLWCVGGLIGVAEDCGKNGVTNCHVNAKVNTVSNGPALLATSSNTTFRNCYAEGTINSGDTLIATKQASKYIYNCYSLGTRTDGATRGAAEKFNNSFVVTGGYSENVAMATLAEIKAAYASLSGWDCSGDHPVFAVKASGSASNGGQSGQGGTSAGGTDAATEGGDTVTGEAGGESAVYVNGIDIMTALSELPDAYEIELKDAKKYLDIYWAYTVMPSDLKEQLTDEQVTGIEEIGKVVSKEVLKDITKRLEKLPEVKNMTSANAEELSSIAEMYQLMVPASKANLDSKLYKKLCDGLEKLGLSGMLVNSGNEMNSLTVWVLVFCGALNVLLLGGMVFIIVYTVKKTRKKQDDDIEDDITAGDGQ